MEVPDKHKEAFEEFAKAHQKARERIAEKYGIEANYIGDFEVSEEQINQMESALMNYLLYGKMPKE